MTPINECQVILPVSFNVKITRYLSQNWSTDSPEIEIFGRIDDIKVILLVILKMEKNSFVTNETFLYQMVVSNEDYAVIMGITSINMSEPGTVTLSSGKQYALYYKKSNISKRRTTYSPSLSGNYFHFAVHFSMFF